MDLTLEEEKMYNGEEGLVEKCMEILVALGDIYGAKADSDNFSPDFWSFVQNHR